MLLLGGAHCGANLQWWHRQQSTSVLTCEQGVGAGTHCCILDSGFGVDLPNLAAAHTAARQRFAGPHRADGMVSLLLDALCHQA